VKRLHIRKPSPALVIALIALFLSLGGTSYAAITLPAKSVGTAQLKTGAVTAGKIKTGAVTAGKIKTGAVTAAKIKSGAVTDATIQAGAVTGSKIQDGAVTGSKIQAGAVTDSSFSGTAAASVAEAGGVVTVSGTTPTLQNSFDRLSTTAITVARTAVGRYEITIPGVNYFYSHEITQVSVMNSGAAYLARIDSVSGHLLVVTYDTSGAAADPLGFTFVVYK